MLDIALAILMLLSPPAKAKEPQVTFKIDVPGYSEADAMVALETFRRNCRPLGTDYWRDVEKVEIAINKTTKDQGLEKRWGVTVTLMVTYSGSPEYGPAYATGAGVMAGHNLWYDIGAGVSPGYFASKRSSQYLCGLSFDAQGDDIFVPVEDFNYLNRTYAPASDN